MASEIDAEFAVANLGDQRLTRRAQQIVRRWQELPAASFPTMVACPAELDGLYRFVEHEDVSWQSLLSAHVQQGCTRIRDAGESTVLVIHDSTSFAFSGDAVREGLGWLGPKQQGFFAHLALAVSADGSRCPFGVLGMSIIMRPCPVGPRAHRSPLR